MVLKWRTTVHTCLSEINDPRGCFVSIEVGHSARQRAMRKKNRKKNRKSSNTKKNNRRLAVVNECLTSKSA